MSKAHWRNAVPSRPTRWASAGWMVELGDTHLEVVIHDGITATGVATLAEILTDCVAPKMRETR